METAALGAAHVALIHAWCSAAPLPRLLAEPRFVWAGQQPASAREVAPTLAALSKPAHLRARWNGVDAAVVEPIPAADQRSEDWHASRGREEFYARMVPPDGAGRVLFLWAGRGLRVSGASTAAFARDYRLEVRVGGAGGPVREHHAESFALPDRWLTGVYYVYALGGGGIDGVLARVGDGWDDARLEDV
jgi:hypothetical protein